MSGTTGSSSMSDSDIFSTRVGRGELALAWVNGYSSVVVRSPETMVAFDPVGLPVEALGAVDLVAVTHEHNDHWDPDLVEGVLKQTPAQVVTTPFLASRLPVENGRVRGMRPGERVEMGDLELEALPCDHAAREPLSFLLRTRDGLTLYHPSDGLPSPWATPAGDGGVDLLLYLGTSLETGARFAELVQPKAVVTYRVEPRAAHSRAKAILTSRTPGIPFTALRRHQVYRYPAGLG